MLSKRYRCGKYLCGVDALMILVAVGCVGSMVGCKKKKPVVPAAPVLTEVDIQVWLPSHPPNISGDIISGGIDDCDAPATADCHNFDPQQDSASPPRERAVGGPLPASAGGRVTMPPGGGDNFGKGHAATGPTAWLNHFDEYREQIALSAAIFNRALHGLGMPTAYDKPVIITDHLKIAAAVQYVPGLPNLTIPENDMVGFIKADPEPPSTIPPRSCTLSVNDKTCIPTLVIKIPALNSSSPSFLKDVAAQQNLYRQADELLALSEYANPK